MQFVLPMLLAQFVNLQKAGDDQIVNKISAQRRQGRQTVVSTVSATKLSREHGAQILDCLNASELSPAHDELIELTNRVRVLLISNPNTTPLAIAKAIGAKTTHESLNAIQLIIDQVQQVSDLD